MRIIAVIAADVWSSKSVPSEMPQMELELERDEEMAAEEMAAEEMAAEEKLFPAMCSIETPILSKMESFF